MSLISVYEQFLSTPRAAALADSATYSYVTSLKSFSGPGQIVKHLETQEQNVVKRKSWKVLSSVEGKNTIVLEVETTIEFVSHGGAYLPGLDSFIIDHIATIPVTHFVHFDRNDKISQIRLSWDQGSLLRQVEVIGARGKNWPVFDGKDQIKMILSSSSNAAAAVPATPPRGRNGDLKNDAERGFSPAKKHIKDPHASLDLFDPSKVEEQERMAYPNAVATRSPARPPPRDHSELFAAGHEDLEASPGGSRKVNVRDSVIAPKGAGSRRFETARLFEDDQDYKAPKIYKTNPARYNHFDLGDADENDPMQHKTGAVEQPKKHVPLVSRTNKGGSQWDFDDFNTPAKVAQRYREQDQVNFSFDDDHNTQDDEEIHVKGPGQHKGRREQEQHFEMRDDGTPVNRGPYQPKPRKDANPHFEFRDEATPAPRRIIARTKAAAGLYANNQIYDEEEETKGTTALSDVTNKARSKAFSAQWEAADESPAPRTGTENRTRGNAGKAFESHWSMGDDEPAPVKTTKANARQQDSKNFWDF